MTATEQKWFERVSAWRASGQSAREFSTGREFTAGGLRHWAFLLKRRGIGPQRAVASATLVRLARVQRPAPSCGGGALTVEVGGARLTVPAGFDETTLRAAIVAVCASVAGGRS